MKILQRTHADRDHEENLVIFKKCFKEWSFVYNFFKDQSVIIFRMQHLLVLLSAKAEKGVSDSSSDARLRDICQ